MSKVAGVDSIHGVVGDSQQSILNRGRQYRWLLYLGLGLGTLLAWQGAASLTIPIILPPPSEVAVALYRALQDGSLLQHVGWSYFRILVGWFVGCGVAIPIGMLAGRNHVFRSVLEPYIEFFRFIPPIAFVTLFMIWFGLGELSKVMLIVYTAFFTTFLSTMAGAMSVDPEKIRAAQCLGAMPRQVFLHVIVPATIPHVVIGIRLALGMAFMTVVAAEFIAAQSGVGYLIFSSRLFAQTQYVLLGILTLGAMGFIANAALRFAIAKVAYRYGVKF